MTITTEPAAADRNATIAEIKAALKRRSTKRWSVKGGRGTAWGWIEVIAPPSRVDQYGSMSDADCAELAQIFGERVHHQGIKIPASIAYRQEYLDRVNGREFVQATPYWD